MKRLIIIWTFIISGVYHAGSQNIPLYSQYMFNGQAINPAYVGSREVFSANLTGRTQMRGFDGNPRHLTAGGHAPLKKNAVSLGLIVQHMSYSIYDNSNIYADYAFRFPLGENGRLSFGLRGGVNVMSENLTKIESKQPDPVFTGESRYFYIPNFGVGIFYYAKKFYMGVSVPALLNYPESFDDILITDYTNVKYYNYMATSGYLMDFGSNFKLKPSFLVKYSQPAGIQYDLNLNLIFFEDIIWIGGSYRADQTVALISEIQVNPQIKIGYSYDLGIGELSRHNNGAHEVMLRYEFNYKIKAFNPKFF
ncbi:MAG: type IX secretion system membrane protein PorP/SprF [Bacteroidales bacterium]